MELCVQVQNFNGTQRWRKIWKKLDEDAKESNSTFLNKVYYNLKKKYVWTNSYENAPLCGVVAAVLFEVSQDFLSIEADKGDNYQLSHWVHRPRMIHLRSEEGPQKSTRMKVDV